MFEEYCWWCSRKQVANGSLVIESMSAALAGHYQCVATVEGVGTLVSRVATVFLAGNMTLYTIYYCTTNKHPFNG